METQMFFKKAKSVKKAVFGRSTWLVRRGQQEEKGRKEVEMNGGILPGGETAN